MIKVNKAEGDSHVVANIKSETRNTTKIVERNDKKEITEKSNNEISIIPLPILHIMNNHTFVQFSLFDVHWKV